MPWEVRAKDDKFCVVATDTGKEVKCHNKRTDAVKHMRALYANSNEFSELPLDTKVGLLIPVKSFAEATLEKPLTREIMAVPYDAWDHPIFGMTVFDRTMAETMKLNFDMNVRGQDVPTDYDHGLDPAKGGKASGWVREMRVGDDALYWTVEFTEEASKEIQSGEWRYFSPEWYDTWTNPMQGGGTYSYVAVGGGLTNKPWIKGMVPLNFSEVMVEKEGGVVLYHKFEKDGTEVAWVSEDDGTTWRYATDDELKNEVVEWEHSEPGTGSPPEPRTDEDDRSGGSKEGSRTDDPFREPTDEKEGSDVKFDKEFLEGIGVKADADEAEVKEAVKVAFSELALLKNANKEDEKVKAFAEAYPAEHAEMQRLRAESLEMNSRKFAEKYERLTVKKGDKTEKSTKGFSALVLDLIAGTHRTFSEGNAVEGMKKFNELLDAMSDESAILDYGETGSQRQQEDEAIPVGDVEAISKMFAEKVNDVMYADKDKPIPYDDAVSKAINEYPELAKAYQAARRGVRA
jgi:hypothetical protein